MTPGETSEAEARMVMEDIGATETAGSGQYDEMGMRIYTFTAWIGGTESGTATPVRSAAVGGNILHDIEITIEEGIVRRIQVHLLTSDLVPLLWDHWSSYGAEGVMEDLGPPGRVFLGIAVRGTGYGQILEYEDIGVLASSNGIRQGDRLCPATGESPVVALDLTLTDVSVGLSVYPPFVVPPTDRNVYLPVEEAVGVDEAEYYRQSLFDPQGCVVVSTPVP
jgi:hypothetical protein